MFIMPPYLEAHELLLRLALHAVVHGHEELEEALVQGLTLQRQRGPKESVKSPW